MIGKKVGFCLQTLNKKTGLDKNHRPVNSKNKRVSYLSTRPLYDLRMEEPVSFRRDFLQDL